MGNEEAGSPALSPDTAATFHETSSPGIRQARLLPQFLTLALHESVRSLASGWPVFFALLSAGLDLGLFFLAPDTPEGRGFNRLAASLENLLLLVSSLGSLSIAALATAGDREDGMAAVYASCRMGPLSYLAGKFLGLFPVLALALLVGLGLGNIGILLSGRLPGSQGPWPLVFSGLVSTALYTLWGIVIGLLARSRMKALILALSVWLVSLFLAEALVWVLARHLPPLGSRGLIMASLIANPAEILRVAACFARSEGFVYGPEFHAWQEFFLTLPGAFAATGILCLHALVPALTAWVTKARSDS